MSARIYYMGVRLAKRKRRCPRCGRRHRWPTEDRLCRRCEGEWVKEFNWNSARGMRFMGQK